MFEKSLPKSCNEGSEKVNKWSGLDASNVIGAFLDAKLIAEVQEEFGAKHIKNINPRFWVSGAWGSSWSVQGPSKSIPGPF